MEENALQSGQEQRLAVVIPTWCRSEQLQTTLRNILECQPRPDEILVHVDAGDTETRLKLEGEFGTDVKWISSSSRQGPGGGRNRLIRASNCEIIVCLDDDSWPIDGEFFQTVRLLMEEHSDAAILACQVFLPKEQLSGPVNGVIEYSRFENCGCVLRRKAFLETRGYLPLRQAYGMEESDLSLQLLDRGWKILYARSLRVRHDTELLHHASFEINSAQITNTGLLAFLRYPIPLMLLGLMQVLNRVAFSIKMGRFSGIITGLLRIPFTCYHFRGERQPVRFTTIRLSRQLR